MLRQAYFIIFLFATLNSFAQKAMIYGRVTDSNGKPIESVIIGITKPVSTGTQTDADGKYKLTVPALTELNVIFRIMGYYTDSVKIECKENEFHKLDVKLSERLSTSSKIFEITDNRNADLGLITLDPKIISTITGPGDAIASAIKTLPGVYSNNELSSQYSVRGGNYDENLVYVNDIEIYRPFLVRAGQQEGLSFANANMVDNLKFSAGGFEAKYGDKMSSVLDIKYRKPTRFAGSAMAGALGGNIQLEDIYLKNRLSALVGFRYRTTQYLLNSLDTRGEYRPSFMDFQSAFVYSFSDKLDLEVLMNYAINNYRVKPQDRETEFGTINQALRLRIFFDGNENSKFDTRMGAVSLNFRPDSKTRFKLITSAFQSIEEEKTDVEGAYLIDELERSLGSENFGDKAYNRGVGSFLSYIRNRLEYQVANVELKGYMDRGKHFFQFGAKAQYENVTDRLNEWRMIDSAGFSIPQYPYELIVFPEVIKSNISLQSNRLMAYAQDQLSWRTRDTSFTCNLTYGVRTNYWTLNNQALVSPRIVFSVRPKSKRNTIYRIAAGHYAQPAFYRELRRLDGTINPNIKAQESYHIITGTEFDFEAFDRPFRFFVEGYYKYLKNLVPYEIDNVRIRYFGDNLANGYATGIDFRVNGEFVKGIQSWANMSFMKTGEDLQNDFYYKYYNSKGERVFVSSQATDSVYVEPGYIPRPTDQRFNFSLFFQDYLPIDESISMQMTLIFGSRLPVGPPDFNRFRDTLRMPPYRRVDLAVAKQFVGPKARKKQFDGLMKYFKSLDLSLEIFNLLGTNNTVSYLWVKDVTNRTYAVPNYLTNRLINLRLQATF
jgi:hypothetical protein